LNRRGQGRTQSWVGPGFCKQVANIEKQGNTGVIRVGNLEAKRDFTDVRDIVRAYRILANEGESGGTFNVGSGTSISIAEILDMILELSEAEITIEQDPERMRPSDTPEIRADISKLNSLTGWKPEIPLKDTIKEVLDEWRSVT